MIYHRFLGFSKIQQRECILDKYYRFDTITQAKTFCVQDSNCRGVYDDGCVDIGPFYLCPITATYGNITSSCIYEKTQGIIAVLLIILKACHNIIFSLQFQNGYNFSRMHNC